MRSMRKFQQKMVVASALVVGTGAVVSGTYYLGYQKANEVHEENILQSRINQSITKEELKGTKVDAMIDSINMKLQIVLVEQKGISSLKLEKRDAKWNSWLTKAECEVSLETRASVGINVKDLILVKTEKGLVVQYSVDDLEVLSLEIMNENIISSRRIFSQGYTDDDKSAIKSYIQEETKAKILDNADLVNKANKAMKQYINNLADAFGVDVEIIVVD